MEVLIREAGPEDVPGMLALVKELATFEREPEAVTVTEEEMLRDGFGDRPLWFGWVAMEGPRLLGMALCYDRYSTWKGRCLYLEDIVVTAAARGKGVGEALFRRCVRHGVEHQYNWMRWQVLDWNTDAIRFYQRFGAEVSAGWLNGDLTAEQMRNLAAR
ncbi:MAG TPA: GNAT family N-acetyltransferase [Flavobacteriales bacterium]|nr:GNAT family N-acetyltransferase [Flavobacteriales bacterium]